MAEAHGDDEPALHAGELAVDAHADDAGSLDAEMEVCRICRVEGSHDAPLFNPCNCAGSMAYIHQDWYTPLRFPLPLFWRTLWLLPCITFSFMVWYQNTPRVPMLPHLLGSKLSIGCTSCGCAGIFFFLWFGGGGTRLLRGCGGTLLRVVYGRSKADRTSAVE